MATEAPGAHAGDAPGSATGRARSWWEPEDVETQSFTEISTNEVSWCKLCKLFVGPGIMIAIAYIDPGNYTTDLQGGSRFQYRLLWSVLFAHVLGYIFQVLVVMQSLATGRTLSEECALEYPRMRVFLWLCAEISSVASDLGYVMGTAVAIKILFHIDLVWGVAIASCDTLLWMMLQALGHRKMEAFCALLGLIVTGCCFAEIGMSGLPWEVFLGFIPAYGGLTDGVESTPSSEDVQQYIWIATSIVGASVCPPNFFLHSALVHTRRFTQNSFIESGARAMREISQFRTSVKFFALETAVGIFFAFCINAIILIVAAELYYNPQHPTVIEELADMSTMLTRVLGKGSSIVFALSIFAGGQSASVTGTLASQYILEGFMKIRLKLWIRRVLTRMVSIIPAFFITLFCGDQSATIIDDAQVVVNFAVPFTLIPILKFVSSPVKMGPHAMGRGRSIVLWAMMCLVTLLNLATAVQLFLQNFGTTMGIILVVLVMVPYFSLVGYIVYKTPSVPPGSLSDGAEKALGQALN